MGIIILVARMAMLLKQAAQNIAIQQIAAGIGHFFMVYPIGLIRQIHKHHIFQALSGTGIQSLCQLGVIHLACIGILGI